MENRAVELLDFAEDKARFRQPAVAVVKSETRCGK